MTETETKTYPIIKARRRETVSAMFFDGTAECADAICDWVFKSRETAARLLKARNPRGKLDESGDVVIYNHFSNGPTVVPPNHWLVKSGDVACAFIPHTETSFNNWLELIPPGAAPYREVTSD